MDRRENGAQMALVACLKSQVSEQLTDSTILSLTSWFFLDGFGKYNFTRAFFCSYMWPEISYYNWKIASSFCNHIYTRIHTYIHTVNREVCSWCFLLCSLDILVDKCQGVQHSHFLKSGLVSVFLLLSFLWIIFWTPVWWNTAPPTKKLSCSCWTCRSSWVGIHFY